MNTFWEERFREEGRIWGDSPSPTTTGAIELFRNAGGHNVLVPGSGYGRNADAFARAGFAVTGIEISETAVAMARQGYPDVRYHQGSVLDMPFDDSMYDGIYCFNLLHLFRKNDRAVILQRCREQLNDGGLLFFVVLSDKDPGFGTGRMVEEDTFESKPGREVHYYSEDDLVSAFRDFTIIRTGMIEEPEDHGKEGRHVHQLRFICTRQEALQGRRKKQ